MSTNSPNGPASLGFVMIKKAETQQGKDFNFETEKKIRFHI